MQAAYKKKVKNINSIILDIIIGVVSCVIVICMVSFVGIDFFVKLTNTL